MPLAWTWKNTSLLHGFPETKGSYLERVVSKTVSPSTQFPVHVVSPVFRSTASKQLTHVGLNIKSLSIMEIHASLSKQLHDLLRVKILWTKVNSYQPSSDIRFRPRIRVSGWMPKQQADRLCDDLKKEYPRTGQILYTTTAIELELVQYMNWYNNYKNKVQGDSGGLKFFPFQPKATEAAEVGGPE